MEEGTRSGSIFAGEGDATSAIREKLASDLRCLRQALTRCERCPGGGGGVPGSGEPGAAVFFLAGRLGPGASPLNPWGRWWEELRKRATEEWGWDLRDVYISTALRCRLQRVTREELRRCSMFLAEEFFVVGPRLVVVSGKVATVALREVFGDAIPGNPKAGDVCTLFSTRFLFELDVSRIAKEADAARIFWDILRRAEEILGSKP